jgi:hypothetical protein
MYTSTTGENRILDLSRIMAVFEKIMETVLQGLTYDSCLVYLDVVIVIGRMFQEHLLNMRKVFQWFREARLNLIPEKCQLVQNEVRYLGHILSPEGLTTDPEMLKIVRECPTPNNKHEIRSFLGLCRYYRRFTSGFANIAKPLTELPEQKQSFQWIPEVEGAFETLKGALRATPILPTPVRREVHRGHRRQ